ncbi:hypothetical protein B4114_1289 [Geobacillus stearothermophilus]|uniref:Uncharacterized protein n=1 Tax=Geobacillus stearothermophilus TaxID=1422 RepID=A0A150NAX0_GEOSE|nr:hypothetical protein B4114_1289 [Geobacillus stearothermophilus]
MVTTEPVTTGGNNVRNLPKYGLMSTTTAPAQRIAPYTAGIPYCPPIAIIVPTAVNVQPSITGKPMPNHLFFHACKNVAMPHVNKSMATKYVSCSLVKCNAPPTISGTTIAPAYIANTCWMPSDPTCHHFIFIDSSPRQQIE